MTYPAEHYAKLYMRQPWGGSAAMGYRKLIGEIRAELEDPMRRCPECEEPGYPTLLEWPERSQKWGDALHRRYLLCVLCGHRSVVYFSTRKPGVTKVELPVDEICALYKGGVTSPKLARMYYVSRGTILRLLKDNGVPLTPRGGSTPLRNVSLDELYKLHQLHEVKGYSPREIAEMLDMKLNTVYHRLKRMRQAGWFSEKKFRPKRESKRERRPTPALH